MCNAASAPAWRDDRAKGLLRLQAFISWSVFNRLAIVYCRRSTGDYRNVDDTKRDGEMYCTLIESRAHFLPSGHSSVLSRVQCVGALLKWPPNSASNLAKWSLPVQIRGQA